MDKLIILNKTKFESARKSQLVDVQCPICHKKFQRRKNYVKRSNSSFCSHQCIGKSKRNRIQINCKLCGKVTNLYPRQIKATGNFCSPSCVSKFYKPHNPNPRHIDPITKEQYDRLKTSISINEFNRLKGRDGVPLACLSCNKKFIQSKQLICRSLKQYANAGYCSRKCCNSDKSTSIQIKCKECNKEITKSPSQIKKNKNCFCSYGCATKFRNRNKTTGYKRSKMEVYLEHKIRTTYPSLNLCCNETKLLDGLELDFYFPDLKLGIELNGITHYEPIYGIDRLARSKDSDKRKMISCYEKGIELAVIDTSSAKYMSVKNGEKFWNEIDKILSPLMKTSTSRLA